MWFVRGYKSLTFDLGRCSPSAFAVFLFKAEILFRKTYHHCISEMEIADFVAIYILQGK
jgi:hypothetical protein